MSLCWGSSCVYSLPVLAVAREKVNALMRGIWLSEHEINSFGIQELMMISNPLSSLSRKGRALQTQVNRNKSSSRVKSSSQELISIKYPWWECELRQGKTKRRRIFKKREHTVVDNLCIEEENIHTKIYNFELLSAQI